MKATHLVKCHIFPAKITALSILLTLSICAQGQASADTIKSNLFLHGIYLDNSQILIPWYAEVKDLGKYGNPTIAAFPDNSLNVLWDSVRILKGVNASLKYNPRKNRHGVYTRLLSIYGRIDTADIEKVRQIFEKYSNHPPEIRTKRKIRTYCWVFDDCYVTISKGPYIGLLYIGKARSSPTGLGNSRSNTDSSGKPAAKTSIIASREPVPRFKTLDTALSFAGVWVNENYFDSIRNNRSPRLDQGIGKSCIIIPDRTLQETRMVWGFHDGAGPMVVVKDGQTYLFYDPELKLPFDTIRPLLSSRLRIGDQYFQRLNHPDTNKNDWGILEEILFSGKYQKEDGEEVALARNGHIKGLGNLVYYEPEIDYADRPDREIDRIRLGQSHEKLKEYGFRFDKDTLLIYTIDCLRYNAGEHDCDSSKLGGLEWKLRKMPE